MITPVFHPNIDPQKICIGNHWSAGQSLAQMVVHIGEMICLPEIQLKKSAECEGRCVGRAKHLSLPLQSRGICQRVFRQCKPGMRGFLMGE